MKFLLEIQRRGKHVTIICYYCNHVIADICCISLEDHLKLLGHAAFSHDCNNRSEQ